MTVVDRSAIDILSANKHKNKPSDTYNNNNHTQKNLLISLSLFIVLAAVASIGWWLFTGQPVKVDVVRVHKISVQDMANNSTVLSASGYVVARRIATVSSNVTGKISELMIEEGMIVERGKILATLDSKKVKTQVELSESKLELTKSEASETEARLLLSKKNLERLKILGSDGLISISSLDDAKAEYSELSAKMETNLRKIKVAQDDVALSKRELDEYTIRAPFSGVVIAKNAQPGEIVSPISGGEGYTRTGICTIVDMNSLEIEVDVNEAYIHRVSPDQQVEAILNAYPDWRIPATVINSVPTADRQKATVKVRIKFDKLDSKILPDMGVQVRFFEDTSDHVLSEHQNSNLLPNIRIPRSAVLNDYQGDYVYAISDDRHTQRRTVVLGAEYGDTVGIEKGLVEGEIIVRAPSKQLEDDTAVAFD